MPRPPRIQYPGAIYHLVTRGDGRRTLFHDAGHYGGIDPTSAYRRFVKDGLIDSVDPRIDRLRDWVYGGEDFLRRVLSMAEGDDVGIAPTPCPTSQPRFSGFDF